MTGSRAARSFRVATYNLKNLFLDTGSELLRAKRRAPPKRRRELRSLARTIGSVEADLLAVQEVGDRQALEAVNELLPEPYPHVEVLPGNSDRGIHLGYLSRVPVELTSHAERRLHGAGGDRLADFLTAADAEAAKATPLRLQRDLLRCDVSEPPLTVYNVHLKSPNQPRWRRLDAALVRGAEVAVIARVLAAHGSDAERPVLLVGDFNDSADGEALRALADVGFSVAPDEDGVRSAASAVPSFWPACTRIDHVFANAAGHARLLAGARVHALASARRASDHFPVSVALSLT